MDCNKYRLLACADKAFLPEALLSQIDEHGQHCPACANYVSQLREIEHGLKCLPSLRAPDGFTRCVMRSLPTCQAMQATWSRWRLAGVAVALFLFFGFPTYMLVAFPQPLVESLDPRAEMRIQGRTVTVPEDVVVEGDIKVYHAALKVLGRVQGNIYLVSSEATVGERGQVVGLFVRRTHSAWEKIVFGFRNISQEVRTYLRGALR